MASVHRTATVSSFDPRTKVRIELQTVADLWTLFITAIYGRCAQVSISVEDTLPGKVADVHAGIQGYGQVTGGVKGTG